MILVSIGLKLTTAAAGWSLVFFTRLGRHRCRRGNNNNNIITRPVAAIYQSAHDGCPAARPGRSSFTESIVVNVYIYMV